MVRSFLLGRTGKLLNNFCFWVYVSHFVLVNATQTFNLSVLWPPILNRIQYRTHMMVPGSHNAGCLGPTHLLSDLSKGQYQVHAIECEFESLIGYGPNFLYCFGHTKLDVPPSKCSQFWRQFKVRRADSSLKFWKFPDCGSSVDISLLHWI